MAGMLNRPQEMNIHSGETWKRMAERDYGANLPGLGAAEQEYGGELPGLGLDMEYAPQSTRGVDTLMKVGEYVELDGDLGDFWDAMTSSDWRKGTALAMLYHGYKRNNSILWALIWAGMGYSFPKSSLIISLFAQDFGSPKPSRCK